MKISLKNILVATLFALLLSTSSVFAQEGLFQFIYKRIDNIAYLAHPMNTRVKGKTIVEDLGPCVDITIIYTESITKIRFAKNGQFFSDMRVISDSDSWPAFFAVGIMKDMVIKLIKEQNARNKKTATELERYFLDNVHSWDGRQLAIFCLYLQYLE